MLKMTKRMEFYYKAWLNSETLIKTEIDLELCYKFLRSIIQLGRKPRSIDWLKKYLNNDISEIRFRNKAKLIKNILTIYEHILGYHHTTFPDYLIEVTNPLMTQIELENVIDKNGNRLYSSEEINKILINNFGPNWEDDFYTKHYGKKKSELFRI